MTLTSASATLKLILLGKWSHYPVLHLRCSLLQPLKLTMKSMSTRFFLFPLTPLLSRLLTYHFRAYLFKLFLYNCSSCVRLVTSLRSGMGKSLYIQRMVEQLQAKIRGVGKACVTVPLHGPQVSPEIVMDYLVKCIQESACTIFHLDIAPSVSVDK